MPQEAGYWGGDTPLVSLGGVRGVPFRGRKIETVLSVVVNAATILTSNPNRISAIIQNTGAETLYIGLGENPSGAIGLVLQPGQPLQIDTDFPWIGDVRAYCAVSCQVNTVEVSVP